MVLQDTLKKFGLSERFELYEHSPRAAEYDQVLMAFKKKISGLPQARLVEA